MNHAQPIQLYPEISEFVDRRHSELGQIPDSRKEELRALAAYVRERIAETGTARLTFICTHNSRRSHLAQVWAKVAADARGLVSVETFSGGTEATAMNPRVVESLRRCGFLIEANDSRSDNPMYRVAYAEQAEPLQCFSKVYDQSPNPAKGFCAVMTCSSADEACPVVPGCELRLPIRYEDPKVADDTPQEATVYDARSAQICREMLFAMQQV